MLQSTEARRLVQQYDDERIRIAALLIRCIAGVSLLVGIAVIGAYSDPGVAAHAAAAQVHTQALSGTRC